MIKEEHNAVIYKSTVWYAMLFGLASRTFTGKKAFAKCAVINRQYVYTGANTNSYFLLQNHPSESLWSSGCSCLKIMLYKDRPVYNSTMNMNVYIEAKTWAEYHILIQGSVAQELLDSQGVAINTAALLNFYR